MCSLMYFSSYKKVLQRSPSQVFFHIMTGACNVYKQWEIIEIFTTHCIYKSVAKTMRTLVDYVDRAQVPCKLMMDDLLQNHAQ